VHGDNAYTESSRASEARQAENGWNGRNHAQLNSERLAGDRLTAVHTVRKEAFFWLGQSQDPRALAYLEQVLKK
jgi:hypothetical protein